jgi:hypothetical protein
MKLFCQLSQLLNVYWIFISIYLRVQRWIVIYSFVFIILFMMFWMRLFMLALFRIVFLFINVIFRECSFLLLGYGSFLCPVILLWSILLIVTFFSRFCRSLNVLDVTLMSSLIIKCSFTTFHDCPKSKYQNNLCMLVFMRAKRR